MTEYIKISDMTPADPLNGNEIWEGVQAGSTRYLSPSLLRTWLESVINVSWAQVTGKPTTFTPAAHTHAQADVTGLPAALAAKAAASDLAALETRVTALEASGGTLTSIDGGTP